MSDMDWWTVGSAWREKRANAEHGELERLIAEFTGIQRQIGRSTVRRCEAAIAFSERLAAANLVVDARDLAPLPLKALAALHRISRYGLEEVAPILAKLLGPDPPGQVSLAVLEGEVRTRRGSTAAGSANAHALRQGRRPLQAAALVALRRWYRTPGSLIVDGPFTSSMDPLTIDVIVRREPERDHLAFRLLPATADARPRPRVREEFMRALSAARVFDAVYLVAGSPHDADEAALLALRVRKCGVGVLLLEAGQDGMLPIAKAERTVGPDLAPAYCERIRQALSGEKPDRMLVWGGYETEPDTTGVWTG